MSPRTVPVLVDNAYALLNDVFDRLPYSRMVSALQNVGDLDSKYDLYPIASTTQPIPSSIFSAYCNEIPVHKPSDIVIDSIWMCTLSMGTTQLYILKGDFYESSINKELY